jgi:RimJ/RimL family protein N-acetyltransferase
VIETRRLLIREPRAEDAADLAVAYADPEVRREDGRVLGRAGFLRWDPETWEIGGGEVELGWLLEREHWGHGYATEAALALRDWGSSERGLTRLISLVRRGNDRSARVAERIGERFARDIVKPGGVDTRLYAVEL